MRAYAEQAGLPDDESSCGASPGCSTTPTTSASRTWTTPRRPPAHRSCACSSARDAPPEMVRAIASHADFLGVPRETPMEKTLSAVDELSGFLVACAAVRPEGIHGLTPKSVKKKLKQPSFAAAVNRDEIRANVEALGVDLDEHIRTPRRRARGARRRARPPRHRRPRPEPASARRFGRVLRAPHARGCSSPRSLARLPYGIDALAIVLFVHERTGSFATRRAGERRVRAVAAAIGSPVLGRLVDRVGQTRVLVATALLARRAACALLVASALAGAPTGVLGRVRASSSGCYPAALAVLARSLWADAARPRRASASGPRWRSTRSCSRSCSSAARRCRGDRRRGRSPAAALPSAIASRDGRHARRSRPRRPRAPGAGAGTTAGLLGPLRSPGLRTLLLMALPSASRSARSTSRCRRSASRTARGASAASLIAASPLGSAVGGIVYGCARPATCGARTSLLVARCRSASRCSRWPARRWRCSCARADRRGWSSRR